MSKYDALWAYVGDSGNEKLIMSFDEIEKVAGVRLDHSFLSYKKELAHFGYKVGKISMKDKTVIFEKDGMA